MGVTFVILTFWPIKLLTSLAIWSVKMLEPKDLALNHLVGDYWSQVAVLIPSAFWPLLSSLAYLGCSNRVSNLWAKKKKYRKEIAMKIHLEILRSSQSHKGLMKFRSFPNQNRALEQAILNSWTNWPWAEKAWEWFDSWKSQASPNQIECGQWVVSVTDSEMIFSTRVKDS